MSQAIEHCENCGVVIGKLETPYIFNDHVVCKLCRQKLQPNPIAPPPLPGDAKPSVLADVEGIIVTTDYIMIDGPSFRSSKCFRSNLLVHFPVAWLLMFLTWFAGLAGTNSIMWILQEHSSRRFNATKDQ